MSAKEKTTEYIIRILFCMVVFYIAKSLIPAENYTLAEFKLWYPAFYRVLFVIYCNIIALLIAGCFWFVLPFLNKVRIKLLVLFSATAIVLIIAEIGLRLFVCSPGIKFENRFFHPVAKLETIKGFTIKDDIFCIDTGIYNSFTWRSLFFKGNTTKDLAGLELLTRVRSFWGTKNILANYIKQEKSKDNVDSAIITFLHHPINSDGFKSIEFKDYHSKKKKVLMLGDSFTWGHSSTQQMNGFCEQLLAKGNIVFNTGVNGADPAQYLLVSKKYVPKLQPDIVVVNLYLGNDIIYYKRETAAHLPIYYETNAGNILSFYNGRYFYSAQSAYDNAIHEIAIPYRLNRFNKFCSLTAVGTLIWRVIDKRFPSITKDENVSENIPPMAYPACNDEIKAIEVICKANNARLIVVIIPDIEKGKATRVSDYKNLLTGITYYEHPFSASDYNKNDGHFNNEGHKKYAAFIEDIIDTLPIANR